MKTAWVDNIKKQCTSAKVRFFFKQWGAWGADGVTFCSPFDGGEVVLGPEESMRVQTALGSDIVMAFDQCTAYLQPQRPET